MPYFNIDIDLTFTCQECDAKLNVSQGIQDETEFIVDICDTCVSNEIEEAKDAGYSDGREDGYDYGFDQGQQEGYDTGIEEAENE